MASSETVPDIIHELEEPGTILPYDQAGAYRGNSDKITKELSSYDADARVVLNCLQSHPRCTCELVVRLGGSAPAGTFLSERPRGRNNARSDAGDS